MTGPPPAPTAKDGGQALAAQWNELRRQRREFRKRTVQSKLRSVNPSYWKALGLVVALAAGLWWWRGEAEARRETDVTIAALAARGMSPPTSEPAPVDPFPNPLLELGLSNQATWLVGVDAEGQLLQARSAWVVTELLKTVDLCNAWLGIDADGVLFVAREPLPGSVPLVVCESSPTSTTVGG